MSKHPPTAAAANSNTSTAAANTAPIIEITLALTPWQLEQFRLARADIEELYGSAPQLCDLVHLCLCRSSWDILDTIQDTLEDLANNGALFQPGHPLESEPVLSF
jgi:hypothetical protein